jgi:hypothetical protein
MRLVYTVVAVAFAFETSLGAKDQEVVPASGARLAGQWSLNADKSEDARERMKAVRDSSGGHGFGGGGGRRGGGGTHGGMGGGGRWGGGSGGRDPRDSASEPTAGRQLMDEFLNPQKTLTLAVSATEVSVTGDDGEVRHLRPDGKKVKAEDGSSIEQKTRWEGANLVTEMWVSNGPKLRSTYSIAPDGTSLAVLQHLESPRLSQAVDVRRFYDPAPPPSPQAVAVLDPPSGNPLSAPPADRLRPSRRVAGSLPLQASGSRGEAPAVFRGAADTLPSHARGGTGEASSTQSLPPGALERDAPADGNS